MDALLHEALHDVLRKKSFRVCGIAGTMLHGNRISDSYSYDLAFCPRCRTMFYGGVKYDFSSGTFVACDEAKIKPGCGAAEKPCPSAEK